MNCDHVFDVLTRGPFPSGDPGDVALEQHLRTCHDCRRMAEALRPAVEMIHESLESEDLPGLPGYHGKLPPDSATSLSAAVMIEMEKQEQELRLAQAAQANPSRAYTDPLQCAAAFLLGVGLAGLLWGIGTSGSAVQLGDPTRDLIAITAVHRPDAGGRRLLAALHLPPGCAPNGGPATVAGGKHQAPPGDSTGQASLLCCTECHSSAAPRRRAVNSIAKLARSCQACHDQ